MVVKKKSKILKIKRGYNPNCSSGMWLLSYYFFMVIIGVISLVITIGTTKWIYNRHLAKAQKKLLLNTESGQNESEV